MSVKIFRSKPENYPEKVALCGGSVLDKKLLMGTQKKRCEWVYDNLRSGIIINTAIDYGEVVGQITALPISNSPVELRGGDLWYIPCIWMRPRAASSRLSEQLVTSMVDDLAGKTDGIITLSSELWMNHRSFLERFGFFEMGKFCRVGTNVDIMALPLNGSEISIEIIERNPPRGIAPRLDFFYSPHCPVHTETAYRLTKEHKSLEHRVQLVVHNTNDRSAIERYGFSWALLLNGECDILERFLAGQTLESLLDSSL